jgi:hypothetical protein
MTLNTSGPRLGGVGFEIAISLKYQLETFEKVALM